MTDIISTPPEPPKPLAASPMPAPAPAPVQMAPARSPWLLIVVLLAVGATAITLAMLAQKLDFVQTESARRLQLAEATAAEARASARQAQDDVRAAQSRLGVAEAKLQDYSAQRAAIDRLLLDSASREQNRVLADFEQLLTLAEQEGQIAYSPAAILSALKSLEARADSAPAAVRERLKAAVGKDLELLRSTDWPDRNLLMQRFDDLARLLDEIALVSDVTPLRPEAQKPAKAAKASAPAKVASPAQLTTPAAALQTSTDWRDWLKAFFAPATQWIEVRRVDTPQALLLSPEQGVYLRENLKLQAQSARLSLLARNSDSYLRSIAQVQSALTKYADARQARTQQALQLVRQLQEVRVNTEVPRARETRAVLAVLAAQGLR